MIFRHHPDGIIFVNDDRYPIDWWQQQEPSYTLPAPAILQEYVPGERHVLSDGSSQWGGEMPWHDGDLYLANAAHYQQVWAQQQQETVTAPDMTAFRLAMLSDPAYQRVTFAAATLPGGTLLVTRLETTLSFEQPFWAIAAQMLHQILSMVPANVRPTPTEAQQWEAIRAQTNIPGFHFNEQGEVVLNVG